MLGNIEKNVNIMLQRFPFVKKIVKRTYQLGMYAISPKIKSEGNIERITPEDEYEYFFGYYDKSPWDANDRFIICIRVKDATKSVAPKETAEIVLIDSQNNNSIEIIATTKTWNVQQGCMLQWMGPNFTDEIIFNDYRDGKYVSVVKNIHTKDEKVIPLPVYSVDKSGKFAVTLDFARLHRLRPGYGYSWIKDETREELVPNETAIWKVNLSSGNIESLFSYQDLYDFETRDEMIGAEHKVNHLMLSPDGNRFMILHRWINNNKRFTRLLTVNSDGTEIYNLSDDDMASHSFWKDNSKIISYLRKEKEGNGYFLLNDKTQDYKQVLNDLSSFGDGHPSVSPDGKLLVTDTYPDRSRVQRVFISQVNNNAFDNTQEVAKVFAPFKYDNDVRCDLHPRWNNNSSLLAIDAVFSGKRALYIVNINL